MNSTLLKETLLLAERAVRGTGKLGKVGRELLCCLVSAGNRNADILNIKQVSPISHASTYIYIYIFQDLKAAGCFIVSWSSYFTYRKHQYYFQTGLASALFMGCRHKKLSYFTAKFSSCVSTNHTSGQLPLSRWLKWQEWQCTAFQDLLSLGVRPLGHGGRKQSLLS